jgi:Domain of unknown function (DUF1840)
MLYTFKSGATGDLLMTGPLGDQMLGLIGREPAARGIVPPAALPAAIQALEQAVAAEEGSTDVPEHDAISLRQRAWPLVEMFKRAQQAQVAVVWGV